MLDSCFVLSGTHQQHQILVLTFALVCSFPPTNSERTWTDSKIIKHHNFRRLHMHIAYPIFRLISLECRIFTATCTMEVMQRAFRS